MNRRRVIIVGMALSMAWFCSGCMMMAMHGGMGHASHSQPTASSVDEVRDQRTVMVVEVPPLHAGQDSAIQVRLRNRDSNEPVSGATVTSTVEPSSRVPTGEDPLPGVATSLLEDPVHLGTYVLPVRPLESGPEKRSFAAHRTDGEDLSSSLELSTTHEVSVGDMPKGVMARNGILVVGGMATMMVVMMLL